MTQLVARGVKIEGLNKSLQQAYLDGDLGGGGGAGVGDLDTLVSQSFENAILGDFVQTGLILDMVDPLNGLVSAKLIHQAAVNQSFKQTYSVDEKFRNKNITVKFSVKSMATMGNVTLMIVDETNMVTLVNDQVQLSALEGGAIHTSSFDMPDNCLSFSYTITALPEAGLPETIIDDIVIELTKVPELNAAVVTEQDTMIRVDTANGYGSTATRIRRFLTIRESIGNDVLYSDSSTLGGSFTILTDGIYNLSLGDSQNTPHVSGITLNATLAQLSTNITTLRDQTDNPVLAISALAVTSSQSSSYSGFLKAGDVVRVHTDGTAASDNDAVKFTISKVGSVKQVNVNPNSKIEIPTSELRFEGASTRGSTATAIVRFDTVAKIKGDAFTVESDAVLGTRVTIKKKGKLDVGAYLLRGVSATDAQITKNQQTLTTTTSIASEVVAGMSGSGAAGVFVMLNSTIDVEVGDIIRVASGVVPVANVNNHFNLSFQEQEIAVSITNTLPTFSESDSNIRLDTANGYGSTGTRIRRFANVRENIGLAVEYVPSAINGDSFLIKEDGIYEISYTDFPSAGSSFGITLNSAQLAVNVSTIAAQADNEVLAIATDVAARYINVSWTGFLGKNDIIRAHGEAVAAQDNDGIKFSISKVGKPNVTGVDVTPFISIPQPTNQSSLLISPTTFSGAATVNGPLTEIKGEGLFSYNQATGIYTALKKINLVASFTGSSQGNAAGVVVITHNGVAVANDNSEAVAGRSASCAFSKIIEASDTFFFRVGANAVNEIKISVLAEGVSDQILTSPESFSTDTALFTYRLPGEFTLATLSNGVIGDYITYQYAAGTNTRTQTTVRPDQLDADISLNGFRLYTRSFANASTPQLPVAFSVNIGKGLKGRSFEFFKGIAKSIAGDLESLADDIQISYSGTTGILTVDAGYRNDTALTPNFVFEDASIQNNGYLFIYSSKSPALTSVPLLQQKIATIKDVKPANTTGGTPVVNTWTTRVLNTLNDESGIVKSLTANQFELGPGKYKINALSPLAASANAAARGRIKLRNITAGTDQIVGMSGRLSFGANDGNMFVANIDDTFTIKTTSKFEIQYYVNVSNADGLGAPTNDGLVEVYTTVNIEKIK